MMTRSVSNRVDDLEQGMRTILERIEQISKQQEERIERLSKQQEEVASRLIASLNGEGGDASGTGGSGNGARNTVNTHDPYRLLAVKGRKLEIPNFDGSDPDGWILRAERYFTLNRLSPAEKIDASFIAFEGNALRWFQWENKRHPITRWEDLKLMILRQFRSLTMGSLCEQFLAIKQNGSIDEYRRRFVELAAPLDGISEEIFLSQFINGLESAIKAEIHMLNPLGLNEAMDLAAKIEVKNKLMGGEISFVYSKED